MASTPTSSLLVQKQGASDNPGTWGDNLNVGLDVLDVAIAGAASITTTGGTTTLTDASYTADQAKSMVLDVDGVLVSNATIIVPLRSKIYAVRNGTSGAYTLTIKTSTGTGVEIPQAASAFVVVDSAADDVDFLTPPTVGTSGVTPIATGGTGATTASGARTNLGLAIGTDVQAYDADLASWASVTRAAGFDTFVATPSSANLRTLLSDETGTGSAVFAGSPALTGTPTFAGATSGATGLVATAIAGTTTLTLPAATDTLVGKATTDTLTNKSVSLAANTLTGTTAQFNTALSDNDFATLAGSETLTTKTISLASNTLTGTTAQFNTALSDNDFATLAGSETLTNKSLTSPALTGTPTFAGATSGTTGLIATAIAGTTTLTLPAATDTLVGKATTDTLTNKTLNLTSNTLSGTTAQFNTALSDGDFATLAGSETLTNKSLTSPTMTGTAALGSGFVFNWNASDVTLTHSANVLTLAGGDFAVPDDAYAVGWDGSANVPTKNAVYDKIELVLGTTLPATYQPLDSDLTSIAALTTTAAGRSALTIADPNADRVVAWDDSAGAMAAIALADITTEAVPASGDYLLIYGAEGDLRKTDWNLLPGAAGSANTALSNLASVAINTTLVSDTDNTDDIGTSLVWWRTGYFKTSIELGAVDTTITRAGAGQIAVEGVNVVTVSSADTLTNKTLTAPKIANGGFIADANGNEQIILNTTASAVNEWSVTNAATGNKPVLAATGGNTNIIGQINGKGTGGIEIEGTATNDNATAGYIGEYVSSSIAAGSAVSMTDNVTANVTSISLTAGDWDVGGQVVFQFTTATPTNIIANINTTSATLGTVGTSSPYSSLAATFNANATQFQAIPQGRLSLSATTTVYLLAYVRFASGSSSTYGWIGARRVR